MSIIKKVLAWLLMLALVLPLCLLPADVASAQSPVEIVSLRTETSKTYDLGNGKYRLETGGGILHYKDNYSNPAEPWKDVDLIWETLEDGRRIISKAPYTLVVESNNRKLTFLDKKTGQASTLELISVTPAKLKAEIVPFVDGVSFQHILPSLETPFEAKFKVTGNARLATRAFDDDGELALETSVADGILTEKLSQVKDKATGAARITKGSIKIDPTLTVQPSAKDTWIGQGYTTTNYGSDTVIKIRSYAVSYGNYRSILEFSLSDLPTGATISSATLSLYYSFKSTADPSGRTYWAYKLTRTDWEELQATWNIYKTGSYWANAGGDYVDSDPAGGSATVPSSYSWMSWSVKDIVQDAYTNSKPAEFLLRDGTESSSTDYYCYFRSKDYTDDTTLRPKLVIEYTTPVAPTITTQAASSVTVTAARLNAYINSDGGEACQVRWGYGTTSKASITAYDSYTTYSGSWATGSSPYHDISGLLSNTTYYFRIEAQNSGGSTLGSELTFTTGEAGLGVPTNLIGVPFNDKIVISWVNGTDSSETHLRYMKGTTCCSSNTTGTFLYEGINTSYTHTGLESGQTYCYTVWARDGDLWSSSYAQLKITTLTGGAVSDDLPVPTQPSGYFQSPDYTSMSNVFFYTMVNDMASYMGMPYGTAWLLIAIFVATIMGLGAALLSKSITIGLIGLCIGIILGWAQGLLPFWIFMISLILIIMAGVVQRRGQIGGI